MLIVVVLLATVLLRFSIVGAVVFLLLPRGPACPRCASELAFIRSPILHWLVPVVQRRWCLECGWSGLVRRSLGERHPHSRVINRTARS